VKADADAAAAQADAAAAAAKAQADATAAAAAKAQAEIDAAAKVVAERKAKFDAGTIEDLGEYFDKNPSLATKVARKLQDQYNAACAAKGLTCNIVGTERFNAYSNAFEPDDMDEISKVLENNDFESLVRKNLNDVLQAEAKAKAYQDAADAAAAKAKAELPQPSKLDTNRLKDVNKLLAKTGRVKNENDDSAQNDAEQRPLPGKLKSEALDLMNTLYSRVTSKQGDNPVGRLDSAQINNIGNQLAKKDTKSESSQPSSLAAKIDQNRLDEIAKQLQGGTANKDQEGRESGTPTASEDQAGEGSSADNAAVSDKGAPPPPPPPAAKRADGSKPAGEAPLAEVSDKGAPPPPPPPAAKRADGSKSVGEAPLAEVSDKGAPPPPTPPYKRSDGYYPDGARPLQPKPAGTPFIPSAGDMADAAKNLKKTPAAASSSTTSELTDEIEEGIVSEEMSLAEAKKALESKLQFKSAGRELTPEEKAASKEAAEKNRAEMAERNAANKEAAIQAQLDRNHIAEIKENVEKKQSPELQKKRAAELKIREEEREKLDALLRLLDRERGQFKKEIKEAFIKSFTSNNEEVDDNQRISLDKRLSLDNFTKEETNLLEKRLKDVEEKFVADWEAKKAAEKSEADPSKVGE